MDIFRKKRNESEIDQCRNYSRIITNDIKLHKITEQEYNAVPKKNKFRCCIFMSIPGLLLILEALFFIYCMFSPIFILCLNTLRFKKKNIKKLKIIMR